MKGPRNFAGRALEMLSRKKTFDDSVETTQMSRCLTTMDLTALGIGSTLGVGVYVLAGETSRNIAGPAVIVSFFIAAVASMLAGLCYAEFGARVPKAGSAYIYSYVTVGEFIAFIMGWNLILEYVIGSASVVKGLSEYLDSLLNNAMSDWFIEVMPMNVDSMAKYPDFFTFVVIILFSVALCLGAQESSFFNNIFVFMNISVVVFVVITGLFKADIENWNIDDASLPGDEDFGNGGFAPYGFAGVIKGAAICFYGFIGFDVIATASEEAKNPQRSIPIAVVVSLLVVFFAYFSISSVLTLMLPYFFQDEKAPLPYVFKVRGYPVAEYIVSIGALSGLLASLMGSMFPLPRIVYAMASDGLLFKKLGQISPRFKTPVIGTMVVGLFTAFVSSLFELRTLYEMMSICTLLAYSMVAACVLLLRYKPQDTALLSGKEVPLMRQILGRGAPKPTIRSANIAMWCIVAFYVWSFGVALCVKQSDKLSEGNPILIAFLVIFASLLVGTLLVMYRQPTAESGPSFQVPFTPWLPAVSILCNIYLMTMLDDMTWIRFAIWTVLGLILYFLYGMWHSLELEKAVRKRKEVLD